MSETINRRALHDRINSGDFDESASASPLALRVLWISLAIAFLVLVFA